MDTGWAVVLGAAIAFVASLSSGFLLPWLRDNLERRRRADAERRAELRAALLQMETSLLSYRYAKAQRARGGEAHVRYFAAHAELALVLRTPDAVVLDIVTMMFVAIQEGSESGRVDEILGETVAVLNAWFRGEVGSDGLLAEVERNARIKFSEDRRSVRHVV